MPIPEDQLEVWAHQGAIVTSSETYADIRRVLQMPGANWASHSPQIFLQGSYANATNVWSESDVDIVLLAQDLFHSDLDDLSEADRFAHRQAFPDAGYGHDDLRRDVAARLRGAFGQGVDASGKAVFVPGDGDRRDADVLPALAYRRYYRFGSDATSSYDEGLCFFTSDGTQIVNYPRQHAENCTAKHQATDGFFKPCVRILKNMRNRMISEGLIAEGSAPSYFLEGALYNVPDEALAGSFGASVVSSLRHLQSVDRSQLLCANRQFMLLHPTSPVTWRAESYEAFLSAVIDFWNQS